MRGKVVVWLGWCVLAPTARADTPEIEDVHVRGQQTSGFESRARLDDAPREITDAASLVEPLLGVHVRRLGADDGFATLSIRGSASNQVAFYLAGVPLPAAGDPTVDLSTLPLWPGAQVRIHRTFTPASLGPGSLGGTLVLDPPAATGPERTDIWTAAGSYGALRMRIGDVSDLGRGVRVATGLSASRTDGDFTYYNLEHNSVPLAPAYVPRTNDDFAQASGLVSLFAPTATGSMRATVLVQGRDQGIPGSILVPTPYQRLRTDRELATVELVARAGRGVLAAQVWGVRQGTDFHDVLETFPSPQIDRSTIASAGGAVSYKARFGSVALSTKVDARGERFEPGEYLGPSPPTGATRAAAGVGGDVDWAASKALSLGASARVDGWYDTSDDAALPASFDARPNAHVGVDGRLGPVELAAHGGYTARPANFVERFGSPGAIIPSPDLKPESAWTLDGGARIAKRFGKLRLDAELDAFAQTAEDLITFEYVSGRGPPKAYNVGQAALEGVEAEVGLHWYGLFVRASYTGLHTENVDLHAPLPGRPVHDLVVDVSYALGPLRVRYGLDWLEGMTLDNVGAVEIPGRVLQQVGVVVDVPGLPGVRVSFDIRNLFDVRTAGYFQSFLGQTLTYPIGDAYYYPLPGRNVLFSVAWRPKR